MSTMAEVAVPSANWGTIEPGESIVGIDGYPVEPRVVAAIEGDVLRLESERSVTALRLYPDSHESVTVIRSQPIVLSEREITALRRNPRYGSLLRSLLGGPRPADGRGEGVALAAMADQNGYRWTERAPGRRWQITERGRAALRLIEPS